MICINTIIASKSIPCVDYFRVRIEPSNPYGVILILDYMFIIKNMIFYSFNNNIVFV